LKSSLGCIWLFVAIDQSLQKPAATHVQNKNPQRGLRVFACEKSN